MTAGPFIHGSGFDHRGFLADVYAAKDAVGPATEADARHLSSLVAAVQLMTVAGHALLLLCAARPLGLVSVSSGLAAAALIAVARCMRWTVIGHHTSHGGYDKLQKAQPGALPAQYRRGTFGVGWRRFLDWLDWMLPEAWDVEHNKLHHYHLSEDKDPDLVERNFELLQNMPLPKALKYASMGIWIASWKATYYSPNTFKELQLSQRQSWLARHWPASWPANEPVQIGVAVQGPMEALRQGRPLEALFWPVFFGQWFLAVLPMLINVLFPVAVPTFLNALGLWPQAVPCAGATWRALAVALLAEVLTNAHSFIIVACNHSGEDLVRYSTPCKPYSAEWFLRCAYSSANFETGSDIVDSLYGWLNYQIEHHMFPDMTPLQYRKLQPLMKSVCQKHGVQYVQQNAFFRTWQMLRVAVGDASMRRCEAVLPPTPAPASAKPEAAKAEASSLANGCLIGG